MLMKEIIFNNIFNLYTINIFTDASVYQCDNGKFVSCPGAIAIKVFDNIPYICDKYCYLSYDSTNNEGEIKAIRAGIHLAQKYRYSVPNINLFSDSNICISGLSEWMENWIKYSKNGVLYNSSNKEVINQENFINVMYDIVSSKLNINLYHQKGHVKMNNKESIEHARKVFKDINKLNPSYELIKKISEYNNYVDVMTKQYIRHNLDMQKTNKDYKSIVRREYPLTQEGLNEYKKYINFRRK